MSDRERPATTVPGRLGILALFGPGLAMAAAGVGAGDVTMASLGGARYGLALLWVPLVAAVLKFVLNEGLARWQLATGETIVEGWSSRLGPIVTYGFLVYLIGWTIQLFAALASTSGVAADLLFPLTSVHGWFDDAIFKGGPQRSHVAWSLTMLALCFLLVWFGRYRVFELVMSIMTVCMVAVVLASSILLFPTDLFLSQWPRGPWWPENSTPIVFAIMGGTGSTVGVLAYSYWMRERSREGTSWLGVVRIDLTLCYVISGIFGIAIMFLAGGIGPIAFARIAGIEDQQLQHSPKISQVFYVVSYRLRHELGMGETVGAIASTAFNLALCSTVVSSLLGMMQSVPYLYADLFGIIRKVPAAQRVTMTSPQSLSYRVVLVLLTILPLPMLLGQKPTFILLIYAIWGAFFMPFLSITLLVMNNRSDWVGRLRNKWLANATLVGCTLMFGWAVINTIVEWIATGKIAFPAG